MKRVLLRAHTCLATVSPHITDNSDWLLFNAPISLHFCSLYRVLRTRVIRFEATKHQQPHGKLSTASQQTLQQGI